MTAFSSYQQDPNDRAAFERWYRETYPALFISAYRATFGNRAAAEDLCQEAIVAFITGSGLKQVKTHEEALAYLKRMVVNAHIDGFRARKLEVPGELPDVADETNPADDIDADRRYEALLSSLRGPERELLGMMVAGFSLQEMAQALRLTYQNAGVRVHRIRRKIRDLWAANERL